MKFPGIIPRLLTLFLLLAPTLDPSVFISQTRPSVQPFRITRLNARLFLGDTGTFSADLFGPDAPSLQSVRTGAGQSTATLVVVEVTGSAGAYAPARQVNLLATSSGKQILSKSLPVGRVGDDGKFFAGFWLYDTGCLPITLTARIVGQQPPTPDLKKTLDFKCGD